MKRKLLTCLFLAILFGNKINSQVSHGGEPLPFIQLRSFSTDFFEEMPSFDLEEELRLDALNESDLRGGYKFAYKFMTDFSRSNSGISYTLEDGTRVWRLGIRSKGALSLNILFTEYEVPEGAQVFLYNPEQTQVLGAFTSRNNSELGILPVAPLDGEELIVEYLEPANASFPGRLAVGEVNHGYRNLKMYEPEGDRSDFYCMPPVVCSLDDEGQDIMARSTVLITINGNTACSGVLLNNTTNDGTPYLLTASHCLNNRFNITNPDYEKIAETIICFFNYESPTCEAVRRGTEEMSVASTRLRAVNEKIDMTLVELLETPPVYYQPYYAGWNISEQGGDNAPFKGIHHPRASVKRVNTAEEKSGLRTLELPVSGYLRNAHWHIKKWDIGSTEVGSSGSPLFDSDHRVIGSLSGGHSYCHTPNNDYYYALFKAWEQSDDTDKQLKCWLDPSGSDKLFIDGLDPYQSSPSYRLSNVYDLKLHDKLEITELENPASGNLFGTNSLKTTEYAEEYWYDGTGELYGTYLVTPSISDLSGYPDIEITVYSGNGKPQTLLHTQKFRPTYTVYNKTEDSFQEIEKRLNREQEHFVRFDNPIQVTGSFFVGYKIKSPDDSSFAVYNIAKGESTQNTAWILNDSEWIKAASHPVKPINTSLFIDPVVKHSNGDSNEQVTPQEAPVQIFVGTGNKSIYVHLKKPATQGLCSIYSANGTLLREVSLKAEYTTIPLSDLIPGIYFVKIMGNNLLYSQKIVL